VLSSLSIASAVPQPRGVHAERYQYHEWNIRSNKHGSAVRFGGLTEHSRAPLTEERRRSYEVESVYVLMTLAGIMHEEPPLPDGGRVRGTNAAVSYGRYHRRHRPMMMSLKRAKRNSLPTKLAPTMTRDGWSWDAVMSAEGDYHVRSLFRKFCHYFLLTFFWRLQFSACPL
jgi:hypothetical protein